MVLTWVRRLTGGVKGQRSSKYPLTLHSVYLRFGPNDEGRQVDEDRGE